MGGPHGLPGSASEAASQDSPSRPAVPGSDGERRGPGTAAFDEARYRGPAERPPLPPRPPGDSFRVRTEVRGAIVRAECELASAFVTELPPGAEVIVAERGAAADGRARLRIIHPVEGWSSEKSFELVQAAVDRPSPRPPPESGGGNSPPPKRAYNLTVNRAEIKY